MKTPSKIAACSLAVCLLAAGVSPAADRSAPVAAHKPKLPLANDDAESLLYLAPGRLVVIRIHLYVDGKDYRTNWKTMIDRYFNELDTNKDGVLSGAEIDSIPTQSDILRANALRGQPSSRRLPTISRNSADSNPRDGKVTRKELRDYLKRIGIRPFSVNSLQGDSRNRYVLYSGRPSTNDAGQKLFDLLDTNNDGKLSRAELKAASKSLRKSDLDDDELISSAELQGPRSPFGGVYRAMQPSSGVATGFLSLSSATSVTQIVRQLLATYDRQPADGRLSAAELGLSAAEFAPFDADKDGTLDFTELLQFLRRPPAHIELIVRIGRNGGGKNPVQLVRVAAGLKSHVKQVGAGLASLSLKNSQVDISAQNSGNGWVSSTQQLDQQFKAADADNNGYLDRNEARRYGAFRNVFDQMDADHDGKVYKKEMHAYFRRQVSLTNSQAVLTVSSQGRDLFKILDLNRDGRLSPAELDAAVGRIDTWDRDGDGQIAKAEIPSQFRLSLGRAQVANGIAGFVVVAPPGMPVGRSVDNTSGPRWFVRMDLNRDGEVSRREFLGTPELFRKLDRNGNGRLDPEEAAAAASLGSRGSKQKRE